ncbi:MAG: Gfo/Idh/MocA family oxidoreductase [Mesorhizobium sp.]|uniref:Gfo/Idh/MocA family protein n=1 Tax=unclassified Mesorhizobium TaxID=325217 RepID=UPI000FCA81E5|nr:MULTISPECIES: Gfo/Idh/MocA family oxidoreductase [unclassified Mesorhizobium]RUV75040.1 Gfo/Idh/MocA family oxidoreductase [Mesorhizobium sp. M5C.F.Cr.IN.023.01.1.1]RWF86066.1 MAG: Gfo/Idh/MocA family oxidoreductase [Mesorhizobium sp.]RWF88017.1 MAG: Gfo/Idh/MocA family oxidoreductase [Mesorhizobium sp.]RWI39361.1 MAG: Gfo/Idh/MocA family oxidoreductase [Mesorhizobium sp.]RWI44901.1 MAG: Gfo/Idh/MocA family oxidoreductase [Mesorhizobium sp.]
MVGVGLIGTGFMGKCHAIAWNAVGTVFPDVAKPGLVHLGEVNEDLAKRRASEFGFAKASGDWRAVVDDPDVDIVSLTTPNQFHPQMAIAILEAGKHLWCEKPMAPSFAEAQAMAAAAQKAGKVAALGYNYIQNPAIRHIGALLDEKIIGEVNHLRIEMDEDFMADPEAPFFWKHEAASGYGALDDFAVHPLSLVAVLFGRVARVMCDMAKPYADRQVASGGRREVETYDIASVLMHLENGIAGTLLVNRSAWGRKGRIAIQIFGSKGSILYDQERMNEFQLYLTSDRPTEQGYRTILVAPHHKPYDAFLPAPGHGLGFNDLKIIECRELLTRLAGKPARIIDFDEGLEIERTVHAMARSFEEQRWVDVR